MCKHAGSFNSKLFFDEYVKKIYEAFQAQITDQHFEFCKKCLVSTIFTFKNSYNALLEPPIIAWF